MMTNQRLIEVVARALVEARNKDPDAEISFEPEHGGWLETGPRWKAYETQARDQIVAFSAIRDHLRMTEEQF